MQYGDINNLYGTSMCQCLPTGNFVGIEVPEKKEDIYLKSISDINMNKKKEFFHNMI